MTGRKGAVVAGKRRRLDPGRMPDVAVLSGADSGTGASPAKGPTAKRPKRNYLNGQDDEDDLLAYLDDAYEMEKNSIGRDGVEPCGRRMGMEPVDAGACVVRDGACEHGESGGNGDADIDGGSDRSEHDGGECFRPKRHGCSDPGECAVRDDGGEMTRCHVNGEHAVRGGGANDNRVGVLSDVGARDDGVDIKRWRWNGERAMHGGGAQDGRVGDNDGGVETARSAVRGGAGHDGGVGISRRHGNRDHAEDGGGFNGGGVGDHDCGVEIARSGGNGEQAVLRCGLKDEGANDNGVNPEQDCSEAVHDDRSRVLCNNGDELNFRAIASCAMTVVKWTSRLLANTESSKVVSDMSDVHGILHAPQPLTYRERNRLYQRKWRERQAAKRANIVLKTNLTPLSDEGRAEVVRRLQRALGPEGLDECVCVSCDRLVRREESIRKEASDWQCMAQMRQSFGEVDSRLPSKLREEYTAPVCVTYLSDVMVSSRSFRCYIDRGGHWTALFSVCNTCNA